MSNGYKAPSGLGSAIRGRSMVRRDYTAGVKADRQERLAEEAVVQSGLGLVQGIAGGVAQLSSAIGENIKSWEQAEEGARTVFEGSGLGGTFEESGYQGADNWMDRWFKSAGEEVETQTIGGKEFSVADLMNVGRADSVAATRMGTAIRDESGTITGYKSLYESIGTDTETAVGGITSDQLAMAEKEAMKAAGMEQSDSAGLDGTTVIENNNQQQQKQNATGGQPPEPIDFKLPDGTVVKTGSPEHKEYLKNFKTKAEKAAELDHLEQLNKQKAEYVTEKDVASPMEGESFTEFNQRLRDMKLNPKDFDYHRYEDLK